MMVGPDVYICNECVDLIKSMMDEEIKPVPRKRSKKLPTPAEIKQELDAEERKLAANGRELLEPIAPVKALIKVQEH